MTDGRSERRLLRPDVVEQSLPGIGQRYELDAVEGGKLVVVLHHSGRRDLYVMDPAADETKATVVLTDSQARTLGAIVAGAYFKPAIVEEIEAVIGTLLIDWVTLHEQSPAVGRSIADLEVRKRTRMTIAAILRDSDAIIAPEPSEVLRTGDRLVVVGRQEDLRSLVKLLVG
jgi:TrkA domain protein